MSSVDSMYRNSPPELPPVLSVPVRKRKIDLIKAAYRENVPLYLLFVLHNQPFSYVPTKLLMAVAHDRLNKLKNEELEQLVKITKAIQRLVLDLGIKPKDFQVYTTSWDKGNVYLAYTPKKGKENGNKKKR